MLVGDCFCGGIKLRLVARLLDDYDLVFWVDSDAVITQIDVDVADLLPAEAMIGMVAHSTPEGREIPNAGVFVCRSTRTMRRLIADAWACTQYIHHKWWENAAICRLLGYRRRHGG